MWLHLKSKWEMDGSKNKVLDACKFSLSEIVLCYEPDPMKAKMLYDAKVLDADVTKDEKGKKVFEYYIHFQGWNKSWDRWIIENKILKANESNRTIQTKLYDDAIRQKKRKPKPSKHDSGDEKDDKSVTSFVSGNSDEVKVVQLPLVTLDIPKVLAVRLEDDCYNIKRKKKLVHLPRKPTVNEIFNEFYAHCEKVVRTPDGRNLSLRIIYEVVHSLNTYFNYFLFSLLLYNFEREQYYNYFPEQFRQSNYLSPSTPMTPKLASPTSVIFSDSSRSNSRTSSFCEDSFNISHPAPLLKEVFKTKCNKKKSGKAMSVDELTSHSSAPKRTRNTLSSCSSPGGNKDASSPIIPTTPQQQMTPKPEVKVQNRETRSAKKIIDRDRLYPKGKNAIKPMEILAENIIDMDRTVTRSRKYAPKDRESFSKKKETSSKKSNNLSGIEVSVENVYKKENKEELELGKGKKEETCKESFNNITPNKENSVRNIFDEHVGIGAISISAENDSVDQRKESASKIKHSALATKKDVIIETDSVELNISKDIILRDDCIDIDVSKDSISKSDYVNLDECEKDGLSSAKIIPNVDDLNTTETIVDKQDVSMLSKQSLPRNENNEINAIYIGKETFHEINDGNPLHTDDEETNVNEAISTSIGTFVDKAMKVNYESVNEMTSCSNFEKECFATISELKIVIKKEPNDDFTSDGGLDNSPLLESNGNRLRQSNHPPNRPSEGEEPESLPVGSTAKSLQETFKEPLKLSTENQETDRRKDKSFMVYPQTSAGDTPADIYGLEHLLRLFVKLPILLSTSHLEERKIRVILKYVSQFLDYLSKRTDLFVDSSTVYSESII